MNNTDSKQLKVKVTQLCLILQPHGIYSAWNSPGRSTGVGSQSLLQGIFPTQGSNPGLLHYRWIFPTQRLNPGLLHCRWILYQLSHKGSPRILEWVTYPFSRGSSQPRNQTSVSYIVGGFFTNWTSREAPLICYPFLNSLISRMLYKWNDTLCNLLGLVLTKSSIGLWKLTQEFARVNVSFCFIAEWYSVVGKYHSLFTTYPLKEV